MPSQTRIIHDLFLIKGGGERLVKTLAQQLPADLMTAAIGDDSFDLNDLSQPVINLDALSGLNGIKTWSLARAFKNHKPKDNNFEHVIYSGVASPLAHRHYPQAQHLFYCHTPPRFVYDKRDHYMAQFGLIKRWAYQALLNWFQPQYEAAVAEMDVIITNSEYVKKRIKQHLNKDAAVVYPPCDTGHFTWQGEGDYYLSLARHDELKRIDLIIEAFKKHPDKNLVIASGGGMTSELQKRAEGRANIRFTGWLDEAAFKQLLGQCLATIYIPLDEDFGMSPVESMAAGKPVIGSGHGGLLETIIPDETGFLLDESNLQHNLTELIGSLSQNQLTNMRGACENRARDFEQSRFIKNIQHFF